MGHPVGITKQFKLADQYVFASVQSNSLNVLKLSSSCKILLNIQRPTLQSSFPTQL